MSIGSMLRARIGRVLKATPHWTAPGASWVARGASWVARGALAVVVVAVIVVTGVMLALENQTMRDRLAAYATDQAQAHGVAATLTGLGGVLPFAPTLGRVTLADQDGVWLELEGVAVTLSPTKLLERAVVVDRVAARRIIVHRPPHQPAEATPPPPDGDDAKVTIPEAPMPVTIKRLEIDRVELGAAFTGRPLALSVTGEAALHPGGDGAVSLVVTVSEPGAVTITLHGDTSQGRAITTKATLATTLGALAHLAEGHAPPTTLSALTMEGEQPVDLRAAAAIDVVTGRIALSEGRLSLGGPDWVGRGVFDLTGAVDDWGAGQPEALVQGDIHDIAPWIKGVEAALGQPLPPETPRAGPFKVKASATAKADGTTDGTVSLSLASRGGAPLTLDAKGALTANAARLDDFALAVGANTILGSANLPLGHPERGDAKLTLNLPRLDQLAALVPLDGVGGKITGAVTLSQKDATPMISADLSAGTLSLDRDGQKTTLAMARLRARVDDPLATPVLDLKAELGAITAGSLNVAGATATIKGGLDKLDVTLAAREVGPEKAKVDARARIIQHAPTITVAVDQLAVAARGQTIRLLQPTTVTMTGDAVKLGPTRIEGAGARLAVEGGKDGDRLAATWKIERLPLSILGLVDPSLKGSGEVLANGTVGGTLDAPTVKAEARLNGVALPAMTEAGLKPLDGTIKGGWKAGDADGDADIRSRDGLVKVRATGRMTSAGRLDATIKGTVDLRLADTALAATGDRARGVVKADVKIAGTAQAPKINGVVSLDGGTYQNVASGAKLNDISLRATGAGDRVTITALSAKTANGGGLTVSGDIDLAKGVKMALALKARNALLADTPLATVLADADIKLNGAPENAKVTGTITLPRVDIRIPRKLPPSVATLDVIERGGDRVAPKAKTKRQPAKIGAGDGTGGIALDLAIKAPGRVFVTGQGFDGVFGGDLKVVGSAATPDITGRFALRRGVLSVLGRQFTFSKGELIFDGGPEIDPRLDIVANAGSGGGAITITGSPAAPEIDFTSSTGLPQNEVLSTMLFGKTSDKLSAGEAVELASAIAELSGLGGGASVLGRLRTGLGLDRLDVGVGDNGGAKVELGRRIADGVYVGVENDGVSGPKGRVEVEITDHLKANVGVGADGAPEVGVGFELDY